MRSRATNRDVLPLVGLMSVQAFAVKLADRRTGSAEPVRQGRPPGGGRLAPHWAALLGWVEAKPNITMPEPAAKLKAEEDMTALPACSVDGRPTHEPPDLRHLYRDTARPDSGARRREGPAAERTAGGGGVEMAVRLATDETVN